MPRTRYARCGDLELAYQVLGEGPVAIVIVPSFVSHVEVFYMSSPIVKTFIDRLTSFARVVIFDKGGTGMSDPVASIPTIEDRAREIEAVMDAAGLEHATLFGLSEGGPSSVFFAGTRPERADALVLFGTYAIGLEVLLARTAAGDPDVVDYQLDDGQLALMRQFESAVLESWGEGEALGLLVPSLAETGQLGLVERLAASPGMARATWESAKRLDVADILGAIRVPTLVVHARNDIVPIQGGRHLAAGIPDARLLEVEGKDHAPWLSDPDAIAAAIQEFLTGSAGAPDPDRVLATVLFTDIVSSTKRAAELGDARWRSVLERHDEVARSQVDRFGGRAVKSTGDGLLATFDGPAAAVQCAVAIVSAVRPLDIEIRAGVHTGECELLGSDVAGMAVHIAARVCALADAGEVLASRTVRDLVVGSGIGFRDRGEHELKGVPGRWELLAVGEGAPPTASSGTPLQELATPAAREHQRPSDRILAAVAGRAPAVVRGLTRVAERRATPPRES